MNYAVDDIQIHTVCTCIDIDLNPIQVDTTD